MIDTDILLALSKFRFLTVSQMIRLGISSSDKYLNRILYRESNKRKATISNFQFQEAVKTPRRVVYKQREKIHFLTKHGARELEEFLRVDAIPHYPKSFTFRDCRHRLSLIDFQIEVARSLRSTNWKIEFFHSYFDKTNTPKIPTSKRSVNPDAVFLVNAPKSDYLFSVEIMVGIEFGHHLETLNNHRTMIQEAALPKAYNFPKGARSLFVFCPSVDQSEDAPDKKAIDNMRKFLAKVDLPEREKRFFAFSTIGILRGDMSHWVDSSLHPMTIF